MNDTPSQVVYYLATLTEDELAATIDAARHIPNPEADVKRPQYQATPNDLRAQAAARLTKELAS